MGREVATATPGERPSAVPALLVALAIVFVGFCGELVLLAPARGRTAIEILKIVVSWPMAIVLIAFAIGVTFHSQIGGLLSRMVRGKGPGGWELEFQHATEALPESSSHAISLTPEQLQQINHEFEQLRQQQQTTESNAINLIIQREQQALYWKFRFLEEFFVHKTKMLLRWVDDGLIPSRESFMSYCLSHGYDPEESGTILGILVGFGMLVEEQGRLHITSEGRQYLQFIGLRAY